MAKLLVVCILFDLIGESGQTTPDNKNSDTRQAAEVAVAVIQSLPQIVATAQTTLSSGSGSIAMVQWRGNFQYNYNEVHGKVYAESRDSNGGTFGVTKRNSALVGAEYTLNLLNPDGSQAAAFKLDTWYSGSQATVTLLSGNQNFAVLKTQTSGSSTSLLVVPCSLVTCPSGMYASGCGYGSVGTCSSCAASTCPSGQYNSACGGVSSGSCAVCAACPDGQYMAGCKGSSPGTCAPCTQTSCPCTKKVKVACGTLTCGWWIFSYSCGTKYCENTVSVPCS